MEQEIQLYLQEHSPLTFNDLWYQFCDKAGDKRVLGETLKTLGRQKTVGQVGDYYFDLVKVPDEFGYANYDMTGHAWVTADQQTNEYGLSFVHKPESLTIFNKRASGLGQHITYKTLVSPGTLEQPEGRTVAFVVKGVIKKSVQVIATQNQEGEWVILNHGVRQTFDAENVVGLPEGIRAGSVVEFTSNCVGRYEFKQDLGHYQDAGIENLMLEKLAEIKSAPVWNESGNISAAGTTNYIDVQHLPFYTIDGLQTKDIDDAIWLEKTDNGFRLLVAIADASAWITPGSEQDKHAREAGTSFYLNRKTIHMLDRNVAEQYCSLNVGEPRQAMIAEINLGSKGDVLNSKFYPAKIVVHARLNYDDVDRLVDNQSASNCLLVTDAGVINWAQAKKTDRQVILDSLFNLQKLSHLTQRIRNWNRPAPPELDIDDKGKISRLYEQSLGSEAQKMVETSMLQANIAAARELLRRQPSMGLYRNQLPVNIGNQPKPAFYEEVNQGHWALQTDFYTHFTSPIRRYCDLWVHRLLKQPVLSPEAAAEQNVELNGIAGRINEQQFKSKQCSMKSRQWLLSQYIEQLVKENKLTDTWKVSEVNAVGLTLRNAELVEVFVPPFILSKSFQDTYRKLVTPAAVEEQKELVARLNRDHQFKVDLYGFTWDGDNNQKRVSLIERRPQARPKSFRT